MPAPYSPKAIANALLQRAFNEKKNIDPLKLQKLVFLAHGYFLAATGVPLVNEPFEAWDYGPVSPDLYREFRDFGRRSINRLATDVDWDGEGEVPVPAPEGDRDVTRILDFIFRTYADRHSLILSDLSHKDGWAWDKTRKADKFGLRNKDIDNDLIKQDFLPYVTGKSRTDGTKTS